MSNHEDSFIDDESEYGGTPVKTKAKAKAKTSPSSKIKPSASANGSAANGNGSASTSTNGSRKKQRVEDIYQKKTPIEHVLLRPDTYIGSVEPINEELWVMDTDINRMVRRELTYTPGLYKIVDEILVNAADNKVRDPSMKKIEVTIDKESGTISIKNDGKGIPIEIHQEEKVYVPELIFGHLLTSSNYDDKEEKITGGRNGYGAKLCNIFSTEFIVETADTNVQKKYKQVFSNNMSKIKSPSITKYSAKTEYTKITFKPDFEKFHMTHLDDDAIALITKRVYDMSGCVRDVKVFLNGTLIPVKNFKSYVELYLNPPLSDDGMPAGKGPDIVYKRFNDNWEVAFSVSEGQFNQVSFVNSINTVRGGTHVNYIADQIIKQFIDSMKKSKLTVKPHQVKNNMWLFVNSQIVNPTFDSQTKETLTLRASAFKSKCDVNDDFMKGIYKSDLKEAVTSLIKRREERDMKKTDGTKSRRITGIPKLEDANFAGTSKAKDCTLILTEGDSAKTLAMAGLSVQGHDKFGVFPLRGKPLNVRDASARQIGDNQEFSSIKQILGLKHGMNYTSTEKLRYGHVLIMADQDVDGSHIKGLLLNMFDALYPGLLKVDGFIQQFITPVVRLTNTRTKEVREFYTESEFKRWFDNTPNAARSWKIKYYKGLGTSKAEDAHKYFKNINFHRKDFVPASTDDRKMLDMAFNKKKADDRKEWLASFRPGEWIDNQMKSVSVTDFINKELILFSMEDNSRSIPSAIDGLKPGQRKILWTVLEANIKDEIKVVSLQGKVTEKAAYHHGDQSLVATIINMAQDFIGSNNINLLVPEGAFGTRLMGGKDAASARYISTFYNRIARAIFHPDDDKILEHVADDGRMVEPRWYVPVIPMVLVNGADGIGTGWSTSIPNYNPIDIIENIRRLMRREEPEPMTPWYRWFNGTIEAASSDRFKSIGTITKIDDTHLQITELPIRVWNETYKAQIESWQSPDKGAPLIKGYNNNSGTLQVNLTLILSEEQMRQAEAEGFENRFKLTTTIATSNMVCFDREGRLRKYSSAEEILKDFYPYRLRHYQIRKEYLADQLGKDLQCADNKARFVLEIIQKKLVVNNRKRVQIIKDLRDRGYTPMPKKVKAKVAGDPESASASNDADNDTATSGEADNSASDFDYLLSMPIWSLTQERVDKLLKEKENIQQKLEDLLAKSPTDIWNEDLNEIEKLWEELLEADQVLLESETKSKAGGGSSGSRGKKGKATTSRKKTTTTAAAAAATSRIKRENGSDNDDFNPGTAAQRKKQRTSNGNTAKSVAKKLVVADSDSSAAPTPMKKDATRASNKWSDLDDSSDEDVTTLINKLSNKKKRAIGGGSSNSKQSSLLDTFKTKTENGAHSNSGNGSSKLLASSKAPSGGLDLESSGLVRDKGKGRSATPNSASSSPTKTKAKVKAKVKGKAKPKTKSKGRAVSDSDDELDESMAINELSDSSDGGSAADRSKSIASNRAPRTAARAKKSQAVYLDISSDDNNDSVGGDSDDGSDFEMD